MRCGIPSLSSDTTNYRTPHNLLNSNPMQRDPITNRPDTFDGIDKVFSRRYFLTPGECNPEQRMPLTLLISRLIEVATLHANQIGIGYEYLVRDHQTWVLSRVAVEMTRYPGVDEHYTIRTWVSNITRLFSERDFEILDADDRVIGNARTVWAVLDTRTRSVGDISRVEWIRAIIPDKISPIPRGSRPRPVAAPDTSSPAGYREATYTIQYTDIDFNRHVNSSRYIELLLNQWTLDFHDLNRLTRFEIAYLHEASYGMEVRLKMLTDTDETRCELVNTASPSTPLIRALLRFAPR